MFSIKGGKQKLLGYGLSGSQRNNITCKLRYLDDIDYCYLPVQFNGVYCHIHLVL